MKKHLALTLTLAAALLTCACTHSNTSSESAATPPLDPNPAAHPEPQPPFLPPLPANGPALCRGNFLKPDQGKAALQFSLDHFATSRQAWQQHAAHLRAAIQRGAGLYPWPKKTPLNAHIFNKRTYDGYTAESVTFETIPGYYSCCTLYRPLHPTAAKLPAILNTHGHGNPETGGRFAENVQHRCAALARLGAIALSDEMFAYGDSTAQVPASAHTKSDLATPMQLWQNIRALDFLSSLPDVDASKLCVTGESGGATQTFLLTALDSRIAINVPCVMVSSYFFGGCQCESGRPVHRDADHFCTNAEIASLCAPRPMLVISDGADWTQHVPETEFPFLQKIYTLLGAPDNVQNAHFPRERHDYGPDKRLAMYKFFANQLHLNLAAATKPDGTLDESHITLEMPDQMRIWTQDHPLPENALHGVDAIRAQLAQLQSNPVASASRP
ncbi:MAG: alpha/beta hydrolase family protein [Phycisphaerae bacterium]